MDELLPSENKINNLCLELEEIDKTDINKNSLHGISPYVGKIRSSLSNHLIEKYAIKGEYICDPFCGSGSVLLEGWVKGFNVLGLDLNPYAFTISSGKLNPFDNLDKAEKKLVTLNNKVEILLKEISVKDTPKWIKDFFHRKTLKEIIAWIGILQEENEMFLLSCLLGILHHQRPGFLSFPASHGAPYLRSCKFPKMEYPKMYEYRNVYDRLLKKVKRTYKYVPDLDFSLNREVLLGDSTKITIPKKRIATIITSPPYMKSLTYARDNRLRLWFLGVEDWKELDKTISPSPHEFLEMMKNFFIHWNRIQIKNDICIIIIGDIPIKYSSKTVFLHEAVYDIAKSNYRLIKAYKDPIPEEKKMVKGNDKIKREIILVLERN